ncbi:hypothetical protein WDW89_24525 [Deltaproteobacteria bacterium TL4]
MFQHKVIKVTDLTYANDGSNDTVTFKMTKSGSAFDCTQADALGIKFTEYTTGTRGFDGGLTINGTLTYGYSTNVCTSVKAQSASGDLSAKTGLLIVYGRDETLYSIRDGKRLDEPRYPFAALKKFGTVDYVSRANVSGCEKCHTVPFLKHAYIYGQIDDANDFYACKGCHNDNGAGGHQDWQVLVDNPARYATIATTPLTAAEKTQYAYKTKLMNDVHMSHAMEFAYPQSMANCTTCHAGKLTETLDNANFKIETCKSCHPMTGTGGTSSKRAPAFADLWAAKNVAASSGHTGDLSTKNCTACHDGSAAPVFSTIHSGYDKKIYADATGTKYADIFKLTIDTATVSNNVLTVTLSATKDATKAPASLTKTAADIVPTALVGLYGYDTKDFLVSPHSSDAVDKKRYLEQALGLPDAGHPRITTTAAANGSWTFTANLSQWADKIAAGTVKRVEIGIMPTLKIKTGTTTVNGVTTDVLLTVALNAPSKTFDLAANTFDDTFYSDIVDVTGGCNQCHDALATTFHSGDRGGNIKICRLCHTVASGGSHLEMQSRSIDSYVHAIHSFQPFDIGDVDLSDPVEKLLLEHHEESLYPKFGTDCKSCHKAGTFEVPDQTKSLPSVFSGSDTVVGRDIKNVPSYVSGPGSRACGSCHRAMMINEDDAAGLSAFNEKMKRNGYLVPNATGVFDSIVETIMTILGQ